MMTNKKSGWAGRTRVGLALTAMLCCSVMIMQCNSKIEEQVSPPGIPDQSISADVGLPVLPPSDFRFDADLSDALIFTISNNTLRIGDKEVELADITRIGDDAQGRNLPIIMMVDKGQQMGFVRKVHMALREADRRKLLYVGRTSSGNRVELALVLPPDPKKVSLPHVSEIPDKHLLKIELAKNEGVANQQKVYDFVTAHLANGEAEFAVVSASMDDDVSYDVYLSNYYYIKEGFIKLYQERAQKMFGKNFYETTKEEYEKVRQSIPMNISIAED